MTRPEEPDDRIETHPDLIDPNWQKHAELDAWLGAKKELKKRRKRERRSGAGSPVRYGAPAAPSRWPGLIAVAGLVVLLVAAIVVHQVQGAGVNEQAPEYSFSLGAQPPPVTPLF
ncbi:hypothetical protein [Amycolatopsis sp. PS_44_ISF1]|uniref:hypothetical protein n=1 Tax=Amycolatopsis sp. PS_44_ISF1 TaxID=2974917 RepID=UPI0028E03A89|nr:hypothetical protein [Amycolatopsis sp. PS_44_ISF1]MDT8914547.1 hypothetical protein [Amycolatopsis sp. PS_44_ISF1]